MTLDDKLKGLSLEERNAVLKILGEVKSSGNSKTLNELKYADYKEIPVDIETFLTDDNYLGKAWKDTSGKSKVYPFWMKTLKEMFPDNTSTNYNAILETGARGLGKSEVACAAIGAYLMYRILCLKNPLEFYGMKSTDSIFFAFVNIKLESAEKIAIQKFQNNIQQSPWFMSKGKMTQYKNNPYWIPPAPLEIIIGSQSDDLVGKGIFFAFFDEISFIRNQDIDIQKQRAKDMIDTAMAGMLTRFIKNGKNPTVLAVASSKRSEQSFMESYVKLVTETEGTNALVVDKPVWEIKPKGTYSEETFIVGLGNRFLTSLIIPEEDYNKLDIYRERGYKLIYPPKTLLPEFKKDLERSLCDYAGVSSSQLTKYFSGERVNDCIMEGYKNPFIKDIIEVGNAKDDFQQYKDFFDLSVVPRDLISRPMCIHLDMSKSKDMTGIAGVWVIGKKENGDLRYRLAFSVSVKAPKGRQISFEKNRQFIKWLREQGFKIKQVSADTYQSTDTLQLLEAAGYKTKTISVDRVDNTSKDPICKPYSYLRNTIYEGRFSMYKSDRLFDEFIDVERNENSGKIDHTPNGHKDALDAVCIHGDTEVFLLSGEKVTIKDLYNNFENKWALAYNVENEQLEPVKILNVLNNGIKDNLIKLTLDNGEELVCTEDHLILARDGSYIEAKDTLNRSLMPFVYEDKVMYQDRQYPYVYCPKNDLSSEGVYLHKLVSENLHMNEKKEKELSKNQGEWVVIHHIDCNRFNNNPDNLVYLTNTEHSKVHTDLNTTEIKRQQVREANRKQIELGIHPFQNLSKETKNKLREKSKINITKYNKSDEKKKRNKEVSDRLLREGKHSFQLYKEKSHCEEVNAKREATCIERYGSKNPFESKQVQEKVKQTNLERYGYDNPYHSKEKQYEFKLTKLTKLYNKIKLVYSMDDKEEIDLLDFKMMSYAVGNSGTPTTKEYIEALGLPIDCSNSDEIEKEWLSIRNLGNCVKLFLKDTNKEIFTFEEFKLYFETKSKEDKKYRKRFKTIPIDYNLIVKLGFKLYNHRVVKIENYPSSEVYDLQLEKIHNFALPIGIFVHNCGATYSTLDFADEYAYNYGEDWDATVKANNQVSNPKEQLIIDWNEAMKEALAQSYLEKNQEINKTLKYDNIEKPQEIGPQSAYYAAEGICVW